jgi:alpha-L-fucosidase 2
MHGASSSFPELCARGGFEVDIAWNEGKLTAASLRSKGGTSVTIRHGDRATPVELRPGERRVIAGE